MSLYLILKTSTVFPFLPWLPSPPEQPGNFL